MTRFNSAEFELDNKIFSLNEHHISPLCKVNFENRFNEYYY